MTRSYAVGSCLRDLLTCCISLERRTCFHEMSNSKSRVSWQEIRPRSFFPFFKIRTWSVASSHHRQLKVTFFCYFIFRSRSPFSCPFYIRQSRDRDDSVGPTSVPARRHPRIQGRMSSKYVICVWPLCVAKHHGKKRSQEDCWPFESSVVLSLLPLGFD